MSRLSAIWEKVDLLPKLDYRQDTTLDDDDTVVTTTPAGHPNINSSTITKPVNKSLNKPVTKPITKPSKQALALKQKLTKATSAVNSVQKKPTRTGYSKAWTLVNGLPKSQTKSLLTKKLAVLRKKGEKCPADGGQCNCHDAL